MQYDSSISILYQLLHPKRACPRFILWFPMVTFILHNDPVIVYSVFSLFSVNLLYVSTLFSSFFNFYSIFPHESCSHVKLVLSANSEACVVSRQFGRSLIYIHQEQWTKI
jgi:hypothetical protein